ncbi:hypothetical protein [Acutalibacter sp. 1XD8-36]|uniref:hypothetical protein n=1 Tax=Acutalibacter sp. 1XD8-36 TaxID=2320852 RepID=UPI002603A180|nr:hypothetical protein [Acutalibacter sp. 1XD8-36]
MAISSVNNSYGYQGMAAKSMGADHAQALKEKFSYFNSSASISGIPTSVSVSPSFLEKCAKDPEKAAFLEENLAAIPDCVSSVKANCLGTVTNISYQFDGNGEIIVIMSGTNDPDGKIAKENAEKKAKEQQAAKKRLIDRRNNSVRAKGKSIQLATERLIKNAELPEAWKPISKADSIEISEEGRLAAEREKAAQAEPAEEEDDEVSESRGGKVAVNEHKRARQIAAAKCQNDVRQVIAMLQKDMSDCKAGLEKGWCDEAEIAKVQALLNSAQARLSQVPREAEDDLGISEFDLAGLM